MRGGTLEMVNLGENKKKWKPIRCCWLFLRHSRTKLRRDKLPQAGNGDLGWAWPGEER